MACVGAFLPLGKRGRGGLWLVWGLSYLRRVALRVVERNWCIITLHLYWVCHVTGSEPGQPKPFELESWVRSGHSVVSGLYC